MKFRVTLYKNQDRLCLVQTERNNFKEYKDDLVDFIVHSPYRSIVTHFKLDVVEKYGGVVIKSSGVLPIDQIVK